MQYHAELHVDKTSQQSWNRLQKEKIRWIDWTAAVSNPKKPAKIGKNPTAIHVCFTLHVLISCVHAVKHYYIVQCIYSSTFNTVHVKNWCKKMTHMQCFCVQEARLKSNMCDVKNTR